MASLVQWPVDPRLASGWLLETATCDYLSAGDYSVVKVMMLRSRWS